ncbi:DUF3833 domain-containing protein [Psychrobacter aquaticus]|uniref:Putative lipoprotein n=1 Tax=Psychrobacter aquaticus CMS 56 TaxID=1354303 RepID=U4T9D4_9GAMM|nr:DUF3833 domain-containing protein [Psychrobacter aquaticus]ERL56741.1 putative lipoprotein precursor [Psychrobacter aquaticus CMS 56]
MSKFNTLSNMIGKTNLSTMTKFGTGLALSVTLLISGCATQNIQTYQNTTPTLDMHEFFLGQIDGWGMFQGRSGEVKKRFYVDINATHEGDDVIVLDEKFSWADGSNSQRIWRLTQQADGSWKGTAGDVIGEATGEVVGNTLHWQYLLELPVDDKTYKVNFDDWMYLIDQDVMLNRSVMKKFGVELGSVTLSLHRNNTDAK